MLSYRKHLHNCEMLSTCFPHCRLQSSALNKSSENVLDRSAGFKQRQDNGDGGIGFTTALVDLRAADDDWWGCFGCDAVAKASHVALRSSDFKVIAGVRLKVWDDRLFKTCVHLHLLTIILHLDVWRICKISVQQPLHSLYWHPW